MDCISGIPVETKDRIMDFMSPVSHLKLVQASSAFHDLFVSGAPRVLDNLIKREGIDEFVPSIWDILSIGLPIDSQSPCVLASDLHRCSTNPVDTLGYLELLTESIEKVENACLDRLLCWLHYSRHGAWKVHLDKDDETAMKDGCWPLLICERKVHKTVPRSATATMTERIRIRRALWRLCYLDKLFFCFGKGAVRNYLKSLEIWHIEELRTVIDFLRGVGTKFRGPFAFQDVQFLNRIKQAVLRHLWSLSPALDLASEFVDLHAQSDTQPRHDAGQALGWVLYQLQVEHTDWEKRVLSDAALRIGIAIWDPVRLAQSGYLPQYQDCVSEGDSQKSASTYQYPYMEMLETACKTNRNVFDCPLALEFLRFAERAMPLGPDMRGAAAEKCARPAYGYEVEFVHVRLPPTDHFGRGRVIMRREDLFWLRWEIMKWKDQMDEYAV